MTFNDLTWPFETPEVKISLPMTLLVLKYTNRQNNNVPEWCLKKWPPATSYYPWWPLFFFWEIFSYILYNSWCPYEYIFAKLHPWVLILCVKSLTHHDPKCTPKSNLKISWNIGGPMGIFSYTENIMYVYMKCNGHSLTNVCPHIFFYVCMKIR